MFHIGLNNRSLVDSQRYSFPGLPCLYLASSAYTCWMELGRPSFDSFQVAMFTPKDTAASVIDLSRFPSNWTTSATSPGSPGRSTSHTGHS